MCPAAFVESRGTLGELWKVRSTVTIMVDLNKNSDLAELVNNNDNLARNEKPVVNTKGNLPPLTRVRVFQGFSNPYPDPYPLYPYPCTVGFLKPLPITMHDYLLTKSDHLTVSLLNLRHSQSCWLPVWTWYDESMTWAQPRHDLYDQCKISLFTECHSQ